MTKTTEDNEKQIRIKTLIILGLTFILPSIGTLVFMAFYLYR
ncbi:hypothetical protein [Bdellovibrio bacteriovorus]|nr:hypothetical protein [Bdellovibrio bacteriovorus]